MSPCHHLDDSSNHNHSCNNNNNNNNNNGSDDSCDLDRSVDVHEEVRQPNGKCSNGYSAVANELTPSAIKRLVPELCRHFYQLGWASGTGGGLSIRAHGRVYCAPSGVQKERIQAEDMFVLDENDARVLDRPDKANLKCSECLSLFMVAFKLRSAGCCIHSHSVHANLVTAMDSASRRRADRHNNNNNNSKFGEFRICNQEMIKGIKLGSSKQAMQYTDTLVVPIIDNVLHERDLAGAMRDAVLAYPNTNAVLVRNHGVYVWGRTWQEAKSMAECYDYLFRLKLEAHKCGLGELFEADNVSQ